MRIGIITMHRVLNFGSVLQAYALQHKLEKMGYDNEIIDYEYPYKDKKWIEVINLSVRVFIYKIRTFQLFKTSQETYFKKFIKERLKLSRKKYNKNSIKVDPPCYDIYMTGSDQVWNPMWIKDDTNFFLSFVGNDKLKISYASSFAFSEIPLNYRDLYAKELNKYSCISVREKSGVKIVKELTGKVSNMVCDPTLLLEANDYSMLSRLSKIKIQYSYILVYLMAYMYNPYPDANNIIVKIYKEYNIPVIYLLGNKFCVFDEKCQTIDSAGPNEFLWLFQHAEFVVTSSFHGTAFSAIFDKPFVALVKSLDEFDERIPSLLDSMNNQFSLVVYNDYNFKFDYKNVEKYKCSREKLMLCRADSEEYLKKSLIL